MAIDVHRGAVDVSTRLGDEAVKLVEKDDGRRALWIDPRVFERFNVLSPTQELVQTGDVVRPSIRVLQLNLDRHSYHDSNSKEDERSLNKLGLLAIMDVAGLRTLRSGPIPAAELGPDKAGWNVVLGVPRSDGTVRPVPGSKVIEYEVLRMEVDAGVEAAAARWNWDDARREAERRRRWMYERKHVWAKAETGAIERAIRAALQLPHAYKATELARPFVVIGWSLDTSDPEVRRQVVQAGVHARGQLYAGVADAIDAEEVVPADIDAEPGEIVGPPAEEAEVVDPIDAAPTIIDTPETPNQSAAAAPTTHETHATPDPTAAAADTPTTQPEPEHALVAGETVVPFGKHKGQTIAQIAETDRGWLEWLVSQPDTGRHSNVKAHARDYLAATGGAS